MRTLSKSRFKLGLECPNKLYYTNKKEYANQKKLNPFLEALAKGGFQVEELARLNYPGGHLLEGEDWDYQKHWEQTKKLLEQENVIIFEAAFLHDNLFIRTDILVKRGDNIDLIEVKSKSFDPRDENIFVGERSGLKADWKPYLFDVAFQKHVIQNCYPDFKIRSFIMMADKSKKASIDGLSQLFRVTKSEQNRTGIKVLVNSKEELGDPVLGKKEVTSIVQKIENGDYAYNNSLTFLKAIKDFKNYYTNDIYSNSAISNKACSKCEFKANDEDKLKGLKSGFEECFSKQLGWTSKNFQRSNLFDIKGIHHTKMDSLVKENMLFLESLTHENIGYKEEVGKLSNTERAWLQIEKLKTNDHSIYADKSGLRQEMNSWKYPLHFIDFETSAVAIPHTKDRRPYEQVAFQFSHHIYHKNGKIEHATEYINNTPAYFPNFDFIRALKKALEKDVGSIFRFHNHENNILNAIHEQLRESNEIDKESLMTFIESISHSKNDSVTYWKGDRDMVDLHAVAKNYYFNPLTKGSNSLKDLLPACIKSSNYLREKYSKLIGKIDVSSKNFSENFVWLSSDTKNELNPYNNLPPIFENWTEEEIRKSISEIKEINNGGAALTAYGRLQYTDMTKEEVNELTSALLKYCELDTLAMVMVYEHFLEITKK